MTTLLAFDLGSTRLMDSHAGMGHRQLLSYNYFISGFLAPTLLCTRVLAEWKHSPVLLWVVGGEDLSDSLQALQDLRCVNWWRQTLVWAAVQV